VQLLGYFLAGRAKLHPPPSSWPFSAERKHWLYDELEAPAGAAGPFTHRILFSDGNVLEVPFRDVLVGSISLPEEWTKQRPPASAKQAASG